MPCFARLDPPPLLLLRERFGAALRSKSCTGSRVCCGRTPSKRASIAGRNPVVGRDGRHSESDARRDVVWVWNKKIAQT